MRGRVSVSVSVRVRVRWQKRQLLLVRRVESAALALPCFALPALSPPPACFASGSVSDFALALPQGGKQALKWSRTAVDLAGVSGADWPRPGRGVGAAGDSRDSAAAGL